MARRFKEVAQARIAAEHAMVKVLRQSQDHMQQDIIERKRLEEQLRHTMSEREAILNNSVASIVLSVKRRHEWVNEKFAQMLGYPRPMLIGQSSLHIHPDEATWLRFGEEARAALIVAFDPGHRPWAGDREERGGSAPRPDRGGERSGAGHHVHCAAACGGGSGGLKVRHARGGGHPVRPRSAKGSDDGSPGSPPARG